MHEDTSLDSHQTQTMQLGRLPLVLELVGQKQADSRGSLVCQAK